MTDTDDNPTPNEDPANEDPSNEEDPANEDPDNDDPNPDDPDAGNDDEDDKESEDKLPEWAQKELKEVRKEAANYRVKLREAIQKLEGHKTPEEFEAAVNELREENEKLTRENLIAQIARDAELPPELAEVLKGASEEELRAHAEKLKKFAPPKKTKKQVVPKGGLDPDDDDEEFDPVAIATAARQARY